MSTVKPFTTAFAPEGAQALPLYALTCENLPTWLNGPGQPWQQWISDQEFNAQIGMICLLPDFNKKTANALAGAIVGMGTPLTRKRTRFALAKGAAMLPKHNWRLIEGENMLCQAERQEAALGWSLSSYHFDYYRTTKHDTLKVLSSPKLVCPKGVDQYMIDAMVEGEFLTRDLINTPANDLGPNKLQSAFFDLARRFGARPNAIVGDALLDHNFPMIHAVGRAAADAPRLLEMTWEAKGKVGGPLLTLVGKGVCFDTGGLNIKPPSSMGLMKKDMGGAATTMGLALMIMRLNLPVRLRLLIPAVENAISSNAMRPGDILRSRKGLSVEINDTDAEGRLVLGDALAYACENNGGESNSATSDDGATIISMATLTGAARVALGPDIAPYFCDDETIATALEQGAKLGFDPVWRLPFWEAYEPMIESKIANLDNAPGGGFAGAITAALFLRRFVNTQRYVHFDIYGHSPNDAPGRSKGGLGQGARAILQALPKILEL